jgi:hypothetical protein
MPKYFTVAEANALLPRLKVLLAEMLAARERIIKSRPTWAPMIEKAPSNGGGERGKQLYTDSEQIRLTMAQVSEWGILIKDVDAGLVDFPALRNGREVYLCWKLGEERVTYWHEIDAGFAGRQPL